MHHPAGNHHNPELQGDHALPGVNCGCQNRDGGIYRILAVVAEAVAETLNLGNRNGDNFDFGGCKLEKITFMKQIEAQ